MDGVFIKLPLHALLPSAGCEKKRRSKDGIHPAPACPAWGAFFPPPPACGGTLGLESSTLSPEELDMLTACAMNLEKGTCAILIRKVLRKALI